MSPEPAPPAARPNLTVSAGPAVVRAGGIEPYRLLFPFGFLFALWGVAPWSLHALGLVSYPGPTHRGLMMQGFEMSFVLGFLLTALPGFTHAEKCRPWELAAATLAMAGFTAASLAGWSGLAAAAFTIGALVLLQALIRRVWHATMPAAVELGFVAYGLVIGVLGGALQIAHAAGVPESTPRFAERLISTGMLLPIVIGVGGLLVPVFTGIRKPLAIPGVAGPHERGGRFALYLGVLTLFAVAIALEPLGQRRLAALLRAGAASTVLLLVWKIWRLPGFRTVPAFALWSSGWFLLLGLWAPVIHPGYEIAGLHLAFIGGFGTLTLAIATRVIMAHGKHGLDQEPRALNRWVGALVVAAVATRLLADALGAGTLHMLGMSAALWIAAWLAWGARAIPRLIRTRG